MTSSVSRLGSGHCPETTLLGQGPAKAHLHLCIKSLVRTAGSGPVLETQPGPGFLGQPYPPYEGRITMISEFEWGL